MAIGKSEKKVAAAHVIEIPEIETAEITIKLIGKTPLIFNRQSEKAKRQLLFPSPKKNAAERAQTLKHEPMEEFRASPYKNTKESEPSYFHMPGGAFKKCLATAALDVPGATKAQIGRLVSLSAVQINVFGVPQMKADMVRQAGIAKTPDVRFRACLPEWCCEVTYEYIPTIISPNSLVNLLSAAGIIVAVGDYRVEKGAGDFGKFRIVHPDDPEWERIASEGGRAAQIAAMERPSYYDDETESLVTWFYEELERRKATPTIAMTPRKRPPVKKNGGDEPMVEVTA